MSGSFRGHCLELVRVTVPDQNLVSGGVEQNIVVGFVLGGCILPTAGPAPTRRLVFWFEIVLDAPGHRAVRNCGPWPVSRARHRLVWFREPWSSLWVAAVAIALVACSLYADRLLVAVHVLWLPHARSE